MKDSLKALNTSVGPLVNREKNMLNKGEGNRFPKGTLWARCVFCGWGCSGGLLTGNVLTRFQLSFWVRNREMPHPCMI